MLQCLTRVQSFTPIQLSIGEINSLKKTNIEVKPLNIRDKTVQDAAIEGGKNCKIFTKQHESVLKKLTKTLTEIKSLTPVNVVVNKNEHIVNRKGGVCDMTKEPEQFRQLRTRRQICPPCQRNKDAEFQEPVHSINHTNIHPCDIDKDKLVVNDNQDTKNKKEKIDSNFPTDNNCKNTIKEENNKLVGHDEIKGVEHVDQVSMVMKIYIIDNVRLGYTIKQSVIHRNLSCFFSIY